MQRRSGGVVVVAEADIARTMQVLQQQPMALVGGGATGSTHPY